MNDENVQLREKAKELDRALVLTLNGFLSGLNFMRMALTDKIKPGVSYPHRYSVIPDQYTIRAYMDKHCRENPLDLIVDGAFKLYHDVPAKKW